MQLKKIFFSDQVTRMKRYTTTLSIALNIIRNPLLGSKRAEHEQVVHSVICGRTKLISNLRLCAGIMVELVFERIAIDTRCRRLGREPVGLEWKCILRSVLVQKGFIESIDPSEPFWPLQTLLTPLNPFSKFRLTPLTRPTWNF